MIGLLKAEFYKLFRRRAFYVCLLIGILVSAFSIWLLNDNYVSYLERMGIESANLSDMGFNGWMAIVNSTSMTSLLTAIFASMFVATDFSTGVVKNFLIRGTGRIKFYFSKLIASMVIPIIYEVCSYLGAFAMGSYLWKTGNWEQAYLNGILVPLGWSALVVLSFTSMFVAFGFIFRGTGSTIAMNLAMSIDVLPDLASRVVNLILRKWFGIENFNLYKYWLGNYVYIYQTDSEYCLNHYHDGILSDQKSLMILVWTMIGWFLVSTIVGCICFYKREIK